MTERRGLLARKEELFHCASRLACSATGSHLGRRGVEEPCNRREGEAATRQ